MSWIEDYPDILDGKRKVDFDPQKDCDACSYTANNAILDQVFTLKAKYPHASVEELFDMTSLKASDNIIDRKFV